MFNQLKEWLEVAMDNVKVDRGQWMKILEMFKIERKINRENRKEDEERDFQYKTEGEKDHGHYL